MDGPHDHRHSPDLTTDEAEGLALWRQYLAELRANLTPPATTAEPEPPRAPAPAEPLEVRRAPPGRVRHLADAGHRFGGRSGGARWAHDTDRANGD